jgi:hypothetical protein
MISRIFCDLCHCEIAISNFAKHEATRKHKKNEAKTTNNAGLSNNSSSPLRKKQRFDNFDNNNDNLVSFKKNCFRCQQLSVSIFQQSLTQAAANIIGHLENDEEGQQLNQEAADIITGLENESTDEDIHLTQEAIDIINELEDNNMNNDGNNTLLQLSANAQQLTRDSLYKKNFFKL